MKKFNSTGVCIPEKHYMADVRKKIDKIKKMVEAGKYFTINKPRQFGKTTIFHLLKKELDQSNYLVLKLSFEIMSTEVFKSEKVFVENFLKAIKRIIRFSNSQNKKLLLELIERNKKELNNLTDLNYFLTDFIEISEEEVVLMIDEVDKSSNNQLFLDFLGLLRSKYLLQAEGQDFSFKSVILAGVHDVKNLKLKLRADEEHKYNSPWNIASEFSVDFELEVAEIASMLKDYSGERNINLDLEYFSEKIHYYTSGHPFLVSKLAEIIDSEILAANEESWHKDYLEQAVKLILQKNLPNFDTLIKNIENNNDLEKLCTDLIVDGRKISYNQDNPTIEKGELYGIFKKENGRLSVHNKIYEQRIYNYLISKIENELKTDAFDFRYNFIDEGNLNLKAVLERFQTFIKEQYSCRDREFLERNGRLIFLAFLKPIINGKGFDFKEVQISQEKRLDVVVTYLDQKYILELKIWRGEEYHKQGLKQLADYLESQGMEEGYLLSFNFNQNKEYKNRELTVDDKKIYAYWV
ncbi:PD-(D/E)XK nuclease superfamily protein [Halanaerobium saccharolyticum]|uniref:PD-(D/E)XK nuclease superfamily protein n=1 Tax=Halanaerobium saccharolyticum TaxID=43595 RepID=A0A4R7ZDY1_9FIRM|nr:AAA-like domain-containing protein [Halanaerobium saccharolyticum]RAK08637.1 PD-(D/E)XK nuclease superfamily protein [Halanaerobium saccharolyticum]TDW07220.1 PD-(D/E)XK nuclease superfamily protein [Halanaerobium saccharolyticum]TDX60189.1 PD-(D/E)XK nuclease superfamily protein [Halanaerobium saccharolyticum]